MIGELYDLKRGEKVSVMTVRNVPPYLFALAKGRKQQGSFTPERSHVSEHEAGR